MTSNRIPAYCKFKKKTFDFGFLFRKLFEIRLRMLIIDTFQYYPFFYKPKMNY